MRRDEPEGPLELVWGVGVELGGHAHLGKAESGQLEERIVPGEASLEQAVNRSGPSRSGRHPRRRVRRGPRQPGGRHS
jgi:hypothetical protein